MYENEASSQAPKQIVDTVVELVEGFAGNEADYESEMSLVEIVTSAQKVQRVILNLENSATQEECRERVEELQASLAELLDALGFDGSQELARRLIHQYDTKTLKQFMAALLKSVTAGEVAQHGLQKKTIPINHHWFGQRVVERVVRATSAVQLQSASPL